MLSAQQNNSFYQIGFLVIAVFLIIYAPACTAEEEPTKAHTVTPVSSPAETKSVPAKPLVPTKIPPAVPTKTVADSWQKYENTTWGVTLQFPSNWIPIDPQSFDSPLINLSSPNGFPQVQLYKEIPPTLTTATQLAQRDLITIQDESSTTIIGQNQIQVDGASTAYQIQLQATDNNQQIINFCLIYATRGTHAFTLWIKSLADEDTVNNDVIENIIANFVINHPRPFDDPTANTITLWATSPLTLDPALSGDAGSHRYIQQIFSGLVRLNHNLEVVPDIATWNISNDKTTYTFHLTKEATFHNGRKVTADDFIYSLNRAANPRTGSTTALDFLGDIAGVQQVFNGESEQISGLTKIDAHTLQIRLVAPTPYFLQKMTYPAAFVVDKKTVESSKSPWWLKPMGTGPFQLQKWTANEILVLAKYNDYYGYKANLDKVVFRMYGENPIDMYKQDEIDVVNVGFDMLSIVDSHPNFRQELVQFTKPSTWYIGFDTTKPPFNDPLIRNAFLMAIDRERIIESVFDDRVPLANGLIPPQFLSNDESMLPKIDFNPEKARRIITEKYASPEEFPAIIYTERGYLEPSKLALIVAEEIKRNLNIEIEIKLIPSSQLYWNELKTVKGNLFSYGWLADYPDPQNFLDLLFYTGRENNGGEYSNPFFDSLIDQAATTENRNDRNNLYRQAEALLIKDAAFIPIRFDNAYHLVKHHIDCYNPDGLGYIHLNYVRLKESVLNLQKATSCFK